MADYQVTLNVPQGVYERAKQIAEKEGRPIEEFLQVKLDPASSRLSALPVNEQEELAAFQYLSDDALFELAMARMPSALNGRMIVLGQRTSLGTITPEETEEYTKLVERGNRLTLRKAWATSTLTERGHSVKFDTENIKKHVNWAEVWIDSGWPDHVLILCHLESDDFKIVSAGSNSEEVASFTDYEDALHWLNEEEYDKVEGRYDVYSYWTLG